MERRVLSGVGGEETEFPEFDTAKLSNLTQGYLNPLLSNIRRTGREDVISSGTTPFARAYATRQRLRGTGEALEGAQVGASKSALATYLPEFNAKVEEARSKRAGEQANRQSELSALMKLYGAQRDTFTTRPQPRRVGSEARAPETKTPTSEPILPISSKGRFAGMSATDYIMAKGKEEGKTALEIGAELRAYRLSRTSAKPSEEER
jgi:hypothetical protein